jgi:hypothetical protein
MYISKVTSKEQEKPTKKVCFCWSTISVPLAFVLKMTHSLIPLSSLSTQLTFKTGLKSFTNSKALNSTYKAKQSTLVACDLACNFGYSKYFPQDNIQGKIITQNA